MMQTIIEHDEDREYEAHGLFPSADAGIFSIIHMGLANNKRLGKEYNRLATDELASLAKTMGAVSIENFYGINSHRTTSNPLFQERINQIIKETLEK